MTTLPPPVSALAAWVNQTIASDDARAVAVLSAASNRVAGYAQQTWIGEDATDAPADVVDIVVQVAARVWLNPNPNLRNQAAGPFTEGYFDSVQGGLYLTEDEMAVLNRFLSNASGLGTITTTRDEIGTVYDPAEFPFGWYDRPGVS